MIDLAKAGYEDLEVYRRSFGMQKPIHQLVLRFPDYEKFDLANQMPRACKSVPANIAEGYARRRSPKEFCNFLTIALGSANEMEVHFLIARQLEYATESESAKFCDEYEIVGKQLTRLIQYWRIQEGPISSHESARD